MREIVTECEIAGSPERVWKVLTDFSRFPQWNPFIVSLKGVAKIGEKLDVCIKLNGNGGMKFNPTVLSVVEQQELKWVGRLGFTGVFDGEHSFKLTKLNNGNTLFVQSEKFTGVLVPLLFFMVGNKTKEGFVAMNDALKRQVDSNETL